MKVRFTKLHPNAVTPTKAHSSDAGFDLVAISMTVNDYIEYDTGIAVEIPDGYVGYVFPRSSISKYCLSLCNSVAVIDSNYRGSIKLRFSEVLTNPNEGVRRTSFYGVGDKVGQLIIMPIPKIELEEAASLTKTDRGSGGFGSTGK